MRRSVDAESRKRTRERIRLVGGLALAGLLTTASVLTACDEVLQEHLEVGIPFTENSLVIDGAMGNQQKLDEVFPDSSESTPTKRIRFFNYASTESFRIAPRTGGSPMVVELTVR